MTPSTGLPRLWYFQHITLTCRCSFPIMGSSEFKRGDWWKCIKCKAERQVIGVKPATLAEQDELTRMD